MAIVEISIQNRVARLAAGVVLVCNNPTDTVRFVFDDEWAAYDVKTARFVYNGTFIDVPFTGNEVQAPEIFSAHNVNIGIYTDDLTSTYAQVPCRYSIKSLGGSNEPPAPDVYAELLAQINELVVLGIQSIEQTTTSTEDGGENIVTVTLTDGTTREFVIRNGSKGDPGTGGGGGADWNQNDPQGDGYIANRTHYKAIAAAMLYEGFDIPMQQEGDARHAEVQNSNKLVPGEAYTVNLNGVTYNCTAQMLGTPEQEQTYIGNGEMLGSPDAPTSTEPFIIMSLGQIGLWGLHTTVAASTYNISVSGNTEVFNTLDAKYLPSGLRPYEFPARVETQAEWNTQIHNAKDAGLLMDGGVLYSVESDPVTQELMLRRLVGDAGGEYVTKMLKLPPYPANAPIDMRGHVEELATPIYAPQILLSSASKTWAIKVDDNGAISATEVV